MRSLGVLTLLAVVGSVALASAVSVLGPDAPRAAVATYNLWLLGTVVVIVALVTTLCFRFFALVSGDRRG